MRLLQPSYSEKLRDPRWQRKRLEKMNEAEFKCEICGDDEEELHVHHLRYLNPREPWEYSVDELQCLCATCHNLTHMDRAKVLAFAQFHTSAYEPPKPRIDPTLKLLAVCAFHDDETRDWLGNQPWEELIVGEPDSIGRVILAKSIAQCRGALQDTDPEIAAILYEARSPERPLDMARDCLHELKRRTVSRRRSAVLDQFSNNLTPDKKRELEKEFLSLQEELTSLNNIQQKRYLDASL